MGKKIERILNDIYMIDESLKSKEKELVLIVEELLKSKPDAAIDENFVKSLRIQLMARRGAGARASRIIPGFGLTANLWTKLSYSFLGMMVALVALSPIFFLKNYVPGNGGPVKYSSNESKEKFSIKKIADNAFGSFSPQDIQKGGATGAGGGVDGGGGVPASSAEKDSARSSAPIMPADAINYKYVYKGEAISASDSKVDVYLRAKNETLLQNFSQLLQGVNSSLIDLGKLQNIQTSAISFSENREFGYEVNILPKEGAVYLYANRAKWPNSYANCTDPACSETINLKLKDMPEDQKIIEIANNFLNEYGISRDGYGEPKVVKNLIDMYQSAGSEAYAPDNISVVYPLKINGMEVYDMTGESDGMFVEVNIRYDKVSGVRNLYANSFESSGYDAETDAEKIKAFAEKGGLYGDFAYENANIHTVEVELGTPTFELVKTWKYDSVKQSGQEYFVPSYIFPVLNKPEGYFYRKYVVVPAIKDLMQNVSGGGVGISEFVK